MPINQPVMRHIANKFREEWEYDTCVSCLVRFPALVDSDGLFIIDRPSFTYMCKDCQREGKNPDDYWLSVTCYAVNCKQTLSLRKYDAHRIVRCPDCILFEIPLKPKD